MATRRAAADRPTRPQGDGRRRPAAARARVGAARRAADRADPRLVAEPPVLGQAVRERARRRVPARRLRPARARHVRRAARPRALHRRRAVGRRRGGDHRRVGAPAARARRLVLRWLRHLRLHPPARTGPHRRDRLRRGRGQARRGRVRHADRPRLPRPLRATRPPTTCRRTSGRCARSCARASASRSPPRTSRPRCAGTSPSRPGSAPTSPPARSTATTCCATLDVPVLVTQGRADTVVLPAMAEHILATCPTAKASWYDGVGHAPHLEAPERFNHELAGARPRSVARRRPRPCRERAERADECGGCPGGPRYGASMPASPARRRAALISTSGIS